MNLMVSVGVYLVFPSMTRIASFYTPSPSPPSPSSRPPFSSFFLSSRPLQNTSSSSSFRLSILALLDLSAAFVTTDHSSLLERLHTTFGISGSALQWLY